MIWQKYKQICRNFFPLTTCERRRVQFYRRYRLYRRIQTPLIPQIFTSGVWRMISGTHVLLTVNCI